MGGAPLVLLLVGLMVPIAFILLAVVFDVLTAIWVIYQMWHDEWSVSSVAEPAPNRAHSAVARDSSSLDRSAV